MNVPASSRRFQIFSYAVLAYTLAVVLWGAFVRATGSGAGCGDHWPQCNGVVVPREPTVATLIEYTHRVTSGLALILAGVLCVWGLRAHAKGHPVRGAAVLSLVFMLTEAAVGAGIVLLKYVADNPSIARAYWMALHLINTFLLVGAQALTAWWAGGRSRWVMRGQGLAGALVGVGIAGLLLLGVTGAIAALGDTLFPATSFTEGLQQDMSETAHILLRLRVLHPLLAVGLGALLVGVGNVLARLRPSESVKRSASQLTVLYALQLGAGLTNLVLLAPVWMQLVHLLLADLVWIALLRLSVAALSEDAPRAALRPSPEAIAAPSK
ncbi:COX15/CtaA family protein [Stigmatella aurantiaca]|uniref:Cytochrome oxidase assembly protein n=1 Tax=Stigmatella aurantiaca (strain DW4/3-1) TaxID=378806 RepID=Q08QK6_STIAD|nr:COX15/CtaA family protein [Stigmatella aurantiaca]ADO75547.1 Cytochrome oxidase assembly protein [Stigmatella aurantiaca DW4/3-1]EAU62765.1 protoheme IX farnesyltransferase [Stigmatella aurantiaca DW4/3-1]